MRKVGAVCLLLAILLVLIGCGSKGVKSVTFSKNTCELKVDETYQIIYSVFPEDVSTEGLRWKSIDESVATVDANGKVTGVGVGNTSITVDNGEDVLATCSVTVVQKPAYERLDEKEKAFVDAFLWHIDDFKNPDSVKVLDVAFIEVDEDSTISDFWVVEVQAENGFGGVGSAVYYMGNSYMYENETGIVPVDGNFFNLQLINQAISEKRR